MSTAPERYVDWINENVGFNPRGQGHSDFLTACIVEDLRARCPLIADKFNAHSLELRQNVGLTGRRHMSPLAHGGADDEDDGSEIDPNIDGVILGTKLHTEGAPVTAPITLENKTIMTAHGKARTNRYNDARAYASHVHNASPATIAAFTIVINAALAYRNPDAFARTAKSSGQNTAAAARSTIQMFTAMRLRDEPGDPVGRCEAVLVLAIDYDGVSPTARLVMEEPAPPLASPFGYEGFLDRICELYERRFAVRADLRRE